MPTVPATKKRVPANARAYTQAEIFAELYKNDVPIISAIIGSAVAMAESGGRQVYNGTCCQGPWQINLSAHRGVTVECANDLACSTKVAVGLWKDAGGKPDSWKRDWQAYQNGSYKKFTTQKALQASKLSPDQIKAIQADPNFGNLQTELGLGNLDVPDPSAGIGDAINRIGDFLVGLANPQLWLRIVQVLLAAILVIGGLFALIKISMGRAIRVPLT